jgi:PKD repeat protein
LQDGATDLGNVSFNLVLGVSTAIFSQNFDGVSAPALPSGWTTSTSGSQSAWVTSTSFSDTAPNAAFSTDASAVGVNELVSPPISVPSGGGQLSFRHRYAFESGFDGGVLEIKIGGGGFTDIVSAGGSFVSGGYSSTLSTSYSNPLGGRSAWSGNSGGFITTLVNLPASTAGQQVQFRWRAGSDSSLGGSGWYVDSVSVLAQVCCGQGVGPTASFLASPTNGPVPLTVTFTDNSSGTITNRFWNFGNGLTTNTTATNFQINYASVGTNTVSLTVSGPGGTNTLLLPNYIVVTNPLSLLVADGLALVAEGCTNGVVDPGETVTLNLGLKNAGAVSTTNLVATLLAGSGVVNPSGPQTYGSLASSSTISRPFTFTASGTCGGALSATLQLQDGASDLGTVVFNLTLGQANVFTENFDAVSVPTLPAGWIATASGDQTAWVTTSTTNNTAPNSVFAPDPGFVGDSVLTSPTINLLPSSTQLTFRHSYNLESTSGTIGYDGGVLEIKIAGGSFTDILTAGGGFASGGYNKTISSSYSNPLAGRQAWSGNSGGFTSTVVNLPAAALGQSIQLRWRCGTDASVAATGWYVDSLAVGGLTCCSNGPSITSQPQNQQILPGQAAAFGVSAQGTAPLSYQWQFNGTNLPGATDTAYNLLSALPTDAGSYDVIVSNPLGSVTSSIATLTIIGPPVLLDPQILSNGYFNFTLSGNAGVAYAVEASTDLSNWNTVLIVTNITGQVSFTETNAPGDSFRVYRARLLP